MRLVLGVSLAMILAGPAMAQEASFRSPSGNIACMYIDGFLRCDLGEVSNRLPKRPADCDLEWGKAFEMGASSRHAQRICHGDTVFDPSAPVLPYGASWQGGTFSCISSERGMSCRNARGAGWDLARAKQSIY